MSVTFDYFTICRDLASHKKEINQFYQPILKASIIVLHLTNPKYLCFTSIDKSLPTTNTSHPSVAYNTVKPWLIITTPSSVPFPAAVSTIPATLLATIAYNDGLSGRALFFSQDKAAGRFAPRA